MTCIIGWIGKEGTYIAADSAGVANSDLWIRKDSKIVTRPGYAMGFTISFRMIQLVQFATLPVAPYEHEDPFEWAVTKLIPAIRTATKDGGFTKIENNVETGGFLILAMKGRIFRIDNDFQVGEDVGGLNACGCGEDYAKGAMAALIEARPDGSDEEMLLRAMRIVHRFSCGVHPPFRYVRIEDGQLKEL